MGFLHSCMNAFMSITSYVYILNGQSQHPLPLPDGPVKDHQSIAAGLTFAPPNATGGFQCQYPSLAGWQYCGSGSDRECWITEPSKKESLYQYNISTDYEDFSPPGVVREYWLNVSVNAISPDGYLKETGLVFNNSFPGPVLQACWGDTMKVHVTNLNGLEGHTTHWHGLRQFGTNQMDGVNGVTQCPIAKGATYTYEFNVTQYGHTWYHSHYQTTYSDGLFGGLTLYGPTSAEYDEAFDPIFVNDWAHANTSDVFLEELNGGIPIVDSLLFNGKGTFLCSDLDPLCCSNCHGTCTPHAGCPKTPTGVASSLTFKAGKKYLLRLINASSESMFIFSIDGHELQVIETDLVPIKPYKTSSIFIGIGQRYEVIVEAKPRPASVDGNYWIRTRIASGCGSVAQGQETTGILRYNSSSTAAPTTNANDQRFLCQDEPASSLVPIVPWNIASLAEIRGNITNHTYDAAISEGTFHNGVQRWDLLDTPLFLNYSDPTINHVNDSKFQYSADYAVVPYDYKAGYVWLVIAGQNIDKLKRNTPAAHPMHLHGHDFVILAQENSTFNESKMANFNLHNPPRRDVALLYAGGYLALAFKPDNPGVWLVHCHIAWHASSGLALQILERQPEIVGHLGGEGRLEDVREGCRQWEEFDFKFVQDDSGI